jgi:hypothetical protein
MLSHAIFTPGQPGWLEAVGRAIAELKPDSFKGYTIGDNTNKKVGKYPWRMDDEKVAYKAYEKFAKAGLVNVCVHKGLFPPHTGRSFRTCWRTPTCATSARLPRIGRTFAAGGKVEDAWGQFEKTGRIEWVTDLAEIPSKYGEYEASGAARSNLRYGYVMPARG